MTMMSLAKQMYDYYAKPYLGEKARTWWNMH